MKLFSKSIQNPVQLADDPHGYSKVLILASISGRISAIDTKNGSAVWSRYFSGLSFRMLFDMGVFDEIPVVALLGNSGNASHLYLINALTGENLEGLQQSVYVFENRIIQASVLTNLKAETDKQLKTIAVIDSSKEVQFIPSISEVKEFYFFLTNGVGSNEVSGYVSYKASLGQVCKGFKC